MNAGLACDGPLVSIGGDTAIFPLRTQSGERTLQSASHLHDQPPERFHYE
jgi:hypothetical protein